MEHIAGWLFFITLAVTNTVLFLLIDGYFEGDIDGLRDDPAHLGVGESDADTAKGDPCKDLEESDPILVKVPNLQRKREFWGTLKSYYACTNPTANRSKKTTQWDKQA